MLAGHVCKCTGDAAVPPSLARLRTFDIRRGVNTGRFPAPFFKTLLPRPALFIYVPLLKLPPGENREEGRWDAAKRKKKRKKERRRKKKRLRAVFFYTRCPIRSGGHIFFSRASERKPKKETERETLC